MSKLGVIIRSHSTRHSFFVRGFLCWLLLVRFHCTTGVEGQHCTTGVEGQLSGLFFGVGTARITYSSSINSTQSTWTLLSVLVLIVSREPTPRTEKAKKQKNE